MANTPQPTGGSGFKLSLPLDEIRQALGETESQLLARTPELLEQIGTVMLATAQQAYRAKSRGETGEDGIKWSPLQVRSLLGRMRRAGQIGAPGIQDARHTADKRLTGFQKVLKSTPANRATLKRLEQAKVIKVTTNGKGSARFQSGAIFGIRKSKRAVGGSPRQRSGSDEIGRKTGNQFRSLQPVEIDNMAVTIGATMEYSEYFDRQRPILPEQLPAAWSEQCDELMSEFASQILASKLD